MINLSHSASGESLGQLLAEQPEECADALLAIADYFGHALGQADLAETLEFLKERLPYADEKAVAGLRSLAVGIMGAAPLDPA